MAVYTETVAQLIDEFAKLPGIGRKSAERLADFILHTRQEEALGLAQAIQAVKKNVGRCRKCYNLAEGDECQICRDPRRDGSIVCVVEQPRDVIALEKAGTYAGLYHVLGGRIAPLEGKGPEHLNLDALFERLRAGGIQEVILGTNPTLEGDGTALYISEQLTDTAAKVTRLARGLASGMVLEFANKEILADALANRRAI